MARGGIAVGILVSLRWDGSSLEEGVLSEQSKYKWWGMMKAGCEDGQGGKVNRYAIEVEKLANFETKRDSCIAATT